MIRTRGWHWGVLAALIGLGCGSKSEPAAAKVESAVPTATSASTPTSVATPKTTASTAGDPVAPAPVVKKTNEPAPEGVFLPVEEEATEIAFPSLPGSDGKSIR